MFDNSTGRIELRLDNWVLSRLAEPFSLEEVKFLPAFGKQGKAMPYVQSRTVIDRLNKVVGAENWFDSYTPVGVTDTTTRDLTDYEALVEAGKAKKKYNRYFTDDFRKTIEATDTVYGGVQCSLTVLGVTKTDVGSPSFAEQLKGAYSDSLKRAGVKFGIGAYFHRLGMVDAKIVDGVVVGTPKMPTWALPVERPAPDEVIQKLYEGIQENKSLADEQKQMATEFYNHVTVMGSFNTEAPLILKRAVYEKLKEISG